VSGNGTINADLATAVEAVARTPKRPLPRHLLCHCGHHALQGGGHRDGVQPCRTAGCACAKFGLAPAEVAKLREEAAAEHGRREARMGLVQRVPVVRAASKTGRNEICPCGSGRKFKRCCLGAVTPVAAPDAPA